MIKKNISLFFLIFLLSCSGIEFVLKNNLEDNILQNNVLIVLEGEKNENFANHIYSSFGNNNKKEYILVTRFSEKKENRIVKSNQVAEKIDYEISVLYNLFYQTRGCEILKKTITTSFYFTPKSLGYNFGSDQSFEHLYSSSIRKNIQKFLNSIPTSNNCVK